jgi:hypothetical protein
MATANTISNAPKELYISDGVFPTDGELIKNRFYEEGYGKVSKVELVKQWECELNCDDNDLYSAAFVTIDYWNNTKKVCDFLNSLYDKNEKTILTTGEYVDSGEEEDYWELEIPVYQTVEDVENDPELQENSEVSEEEDLKLQMARIVDRLSLVENKTFGTEGVVKYLFEVDRNNSVKKARKEKAVKIQKERRAAQRGWRNRLRPRSVLRARM